MSPAELVRNVERFLAAPDPKALPVLTQDTHNLSDMVGWASGPIDPEGRFTERLLALLAALRARHEAAPDDSIAALHDALGQLAETVARHDRDLAVERDADDEDDF